MGLTQEYRDILSGGVPLFYLNDRRHLISTIQVPTVCISVQFAIFSEASVRKHPVLSTDAYYFATSSSQWATGHLKIRQMADQVGHDTSKEI